MVFRCQHNKKYVVDWLYAGRYINLKTFGRNAECVPIYEDSERKPLFLIFQFTVHYTLMV